MSNCIKLLQEKPLPDFIEQSLLIDFKKTLESKSIPAADYGGLVTDQTTLNHVENHAEYTATYSKSGTVSFYQISSDLLAFLNDYYKDSSNLDTKLSFWYQLVGPGIRVHPHIDDEQKRSCGFLYILDPGGSNVKTQWYTVKTEFQDLRIVPGRIIPYTVLDPDYSIILEKRSWYKIKTDSIHSVENLESLRFMLAANIS
jgi:hypothetical protein